MPKARIDVSQHFVTFYSPGTFFAEDRVEEIDTWDVNEAIRRATKISERYGATPYGFRFTTRGRGANELDSKVIATSPMHFMHVKLRSLATVERENLPDEQILRSNMRGNGYKRVATTTKGWRWTQPVADDDIVLGDEDVRRALSERRTDKAPLEGEG